MSVEESTATQSTTTSASSRRSREAAGIATSTSSATPTAEVQEQGQQHGGRKAEVPWPSATGVGNVQQPTDAATKVTRRTADTSQPTSIDSGTEVLEGQPASNQAKGELSRTDSGHAPWSGDRRPRSIFGLTRRAVVVAAVVLLVGIVAALVYALLARRGRSAARTGKDLAAARLANDTAEAFG
ncbi:uncharacterized protein LOC144105660 [Amblyomma americanum]